MTFPWLSVRPGAGAGARLAAQLRELRDRAALCYRLGFTAEQTTSRLAAEVAWEHDPPSQRSPHQRPAGLSDSAIAELVRETYARRPSGVL